VSQQGHNLHVHSLDARTRTRHPARDDVARYTQANQQAMLLKLVCNAWSYHLHREHCNTRSWRWDCVSMGEAGVPAGVLRSTPLGLFVVIHPAASEEYCGARLESAGQRPLPRWAMRASSRSSKIDCQLSYIQDIVFCRQQNSRDVFEHHDPGRQCIPQSERCLNLD